MVDFRRLRQPHPYIAMVPQWDLLDLLADAAQAEPTFGLRLEHEVTGLLTEGGRTVRSATAPRRARVNYAPISPSPATAAPRWSGRSAIWRRASIRCPSTCGGSGCPGRTTPSTR